MSDKPFCANFNSGISPTSHQTKFILLFAFLLPSIRLYFTKKIYFYRPLYRTRVRLVIFGRGNDLTN